MYIFNKNKYIFTDLFPIFYSRLFNRTVLSLEQITIQNNQTILILKINFMNFLVYYLIYLLEFT